MCRILYGCVDWNGPNTFRRGKDLVASYTGAWIETLLLPEAKGIVAVASYTGAWIETVSEVWIHSSLIVASYTGAWIETPYGIEIILANLSHPIRVRGLKLLGLASRED